MQIFTAEKNFKWKNRLRIFIPMRFAGGGDNWARTSDIMINSHALYRLSYGGIYEPCIKKIQGNVGITYFSGRLPSEYFRHV